ncbi:MAG: Holliday junction branch migration DNA helicase RuvB [Spirochaeta sp.]
MDSELHPEYSLSDEQETRLRPITLQDFLGQETVTSNLAVFIRAARSREEALDHVFLNGPPGLGKTTLAGIMAHEMAADFRVTSAPALEKPKDLAGILTTLPPGSVFFIDEIHRLRPVLEEMLYTAMEDFELDWVIGQGPSARSVRIPISRFTLVGATTKAGSVSAPMHSRFGISVRLNLYNDQDIIRILRRSADLMDIPVSEDALPLLAQCSRGTPRVANRILRRMRDFAQVLGDGRINIDSVRHGMKRLEIDSHGLERHDREILKTIISHYNGGPVGAETLAISIGESVDTLEDFYEPYLIQRGFIQRSPRGRMATPLAYEHLQMELPPDADQRLLF